MTVVVKNIISSLVFTFQINNKFSVATLHEILEQKKVKGSALMAIPKVSSPRRITEDDGEQVVSSLHSSVQLLYSVIKTIVLCRSRRRCRPRILKFLITELKKIFI